MQFSIMKADGRKLVLGCAMVVTAAAASGCSSQVARFSDGLDGISTASTANQRAIINGPVSQPYPADTVAIQPAPADGRYAQSVSRSSLQPVSSQPLSAVTQAQVSQAAPQVAAVSSNPNNVRVVAAPPPVRVDRTTTGTVVSSAKPFKKASVETPSRTIQSKTMRLPSDHVPVPSAPRAERVAVLPQQPKLKDSKTAASVDASVANNAKSKPRDTNIASRSEAGSYKVQQGDTLSAISRRTGVSVVALKRANGMQDGFIRIGQTLKVPSGGAQAVVAAKPVVDPVKTASTPKSVEATPTRELASYTPPKKTEKVIRQAEDDDVVAPDSTGISKMRWPVRGRVISSFGGNQGSDGIDIAVPKGTPVKAAENGVVIYAGNGLKEFGNTVLVRHENGLVTVYGNASELTVSRGQKVKRGQEIAVSGMSGKADSPKLHFEVRKNSAPVDPTTFLE